MPRITGPKVATSNSASRPQTWVRPRRGEWTTSSSGKRSDPVNLYVHGSLDDVRRAFEKSGWSVADPKTVPNAVKYAATALGDVFIEKPAQAVTRGVVGAWDAVTGRKDHAALPNPFQPALDRMPVSDQTFLGKKQVLAFEKGNDPLGGRHHFRVFDTGQVDKNGQHVWAVAATRDTSVKYDLTRPKDFFTIHFIEKNADPERDTVLAALKAGGTVKSAAALPLEFGKRDDGATAHGAWDVVLGG